MPKPRTATNILALKGAFAHDPARGREREFEPEPKAGIGPAPDYLNEGEVAAWDYVVGIAPVGVLGDCDRVHLEVVARLYAFVRVTPMADISDGKLARLDQMLGKMGLNPSERSKVKAAKQKLSNPFNDL